MTGKTVVGKARFGRSTSSARYRSGPRPANPIRDSGHTAAPKSGCTGAIFAFIPLQREHLANRGRPCTAKSGHSQTTARFTNPGPSFDHLVRSEQDRLREACQGPGITSTLPKGAELDNQRAGQIALRIGFRALAPVWLWLGSAQIRSANGGSLLHPKCPPRAQ
jgi:hypothetical protein